MKVADPGKFWEKMKMAELKKALKNFLAVIPGVDGVSMLYVKQKIKLLTSMQALCDLKNGC